MVNEALAPGDSAVRHGALLYRAPEEFALAAGDFVAAGLRGGEAVFVAAAGPALDRVRARAGALSAQATWADLGNLGGNPRRVMGAMREFAAAQQGRPVRIAQQAGWPLRPPEELGEAIRDEVLWDLTAGPVQLLCGYDLGLGSRALSCVQCAHRFLVHPDGWRGSGSYAGPGVLAGACDRPLARPPVTAAVVAFRDDLSLVRQVVSERARRAGLSPDRVVDLTLAVGELTANTLAHASGQGTLTMWRAGGEIVCQVQDHGQIGDPLAGTLRPDLAAGDGGLGLWVVHQVCDLVQTRTGPGGTTTRLHMRLDQAAVPVSAGS